MIIAPNAWYQEGLRLPLEQEAKLLATDPALNAEALGFLKVGHFYSAYRAEWEMIKCMTLDPLTFARAGYIERYASTEFGTILTTSGLYAIKGDLPDPD